MTILARMFWSSRPISWVNTAYPFAVAYYFLKPELSPELIVGTLFFLIPYNLLMYGINDVFDYESDLRNPRKGGLEGALLSPVYHRATLFWSGAISLPFVIYLLAVGNPTSGLLLIVVLFAVVSYSAKGLRFKEVPFLDSITSASHFVGPMLVGVSLAGGDLLNSQLFLITLAFTFWGIASHAFGAVQDVQADRAAEISSVATAIGARSTTRMALLTYALAGALVLPLAWPGPLAAAAALPYLLIIAPYWNIDDASCESANRGWKKFIALNYLAGAIVTLILFEVVKLQA